MIQLDSKHQQSTGTLNSHFPAAVNSPFAAQNSAFSTSHSSSTVFQTASHLPLQDSASSSISHASFRTYPHSPLGITQNSTNYSSNSSSFTHQNVVFNPRQSPLHLNSPAPLHALSFQNPSYSSQEIQASFLPREDLESQNFVELNSLKAQGQPPLYLQETFPSHSCLSAPQTSSEVGVEVSVGPQTSFHVYDSQAGTSSYVTYNSFTDTKNDPDYFTPPTENKKDPQHASFSSLAPASVTIFSTNHNMLQSTALPADYTLPTSHHTAITMELDSTDQDSPT